MKYTTYDPATGQILSVLTSTDPLQIQTNLEGQSYVEGAYDNTYWIVAAQAVKKPADPSTALRPHVFDYSTGQWILDLPSAMIKNRQHRLSLLAAVDRVNPVWFASLDNQQQHELQQYRQALLDVPQQAGFPITTVWPSKPTWL